MPSGRKHLEINKNIFIILVFLFYLAGLLITQKWVLFGFIFGVYYLTPDLDKDGTDPDRAWGAMQCLWNFYSKVFAHRGASHNLLWGTVSRVAYLSGLIVVVYVLFCFFILEQNVDIIKPLSILTDFIIMNKLIILKFIAGIFIADICHILADWHFSRKKKKC